MKIVLIKEYPNVGNRILQPGQVGVWDTAAAKAMIKEKVAVEYNPVIHKPYQKGAFVDLDAMKNDTKTPKTNNKNKVSNPTK
jgi:hypothetical protein